MKERIFLFGGAFNPPHKGHESLVNAAIRKLNPVLAVILPTAYSPHKQSGYTKFAHRVAMCAVFKQFGNVKISQVEHRGRKKRNYSIQTIRHFQKKCPTKEICFLIGSDMLKSFETWNRYRRILAEVTLVVASRESDESAELTAAISRLQKEGGKIILLQYEPVVISSSEIRSRLESGQDVPEYLSQSVSEYIKKHGLYHVKFKERR